MEPFKQDGKSHQDMVDEPLVLQRFLGGLPDDNKEANDDVNANEFT